MIKIDLNGVVVDKKKLDILDEQQLRDILLNLKGVQQELSELIVQRAKNKEYLSPNQAREITELVKDGKLERAIVSHMFFLQSSREEAETYVNIINDNIEDLDIPEVQERLRKLKSEYGLKS